MKKLLFLLLIFLLPSVLLGRNITAYNIDGRQMEAVKGEILVKFADGVSANTVSAFNVKAGASVLSQIKSIGVKRIKIPPGRDFNEVLDEYRNNPDVEFAEPNGLVYPLSYKLPEQYGDIDEMKDAQWGLYNIKAHYAWADETGSRDVVIAILDTGVDYTHPDLKDNMWEDELGNHGWDFVNDNNDPMDDHNHGTHVAGIAGAVSSTYGVVGAAWQCSIMAVKVLPDSSPGSWGDVAAGIEYAADNGAHIINMSLGSQDSSVAVEIAVNYAYDKGVLLIAASGNINMSPELKVVYPAKHHNVMAVGATDSDNNRASFSCYGPELDMVAPGVDIKSTVIGGGYEDDWEGTSMAAPFVAGVAALIASRFSGAGISWRPDDVKDILISNTHRLASSRWDAETGYGLLDARAALKAVQPFGVDRKKVIAYPNPFNPVDSGGGVNIRMKTDGDDYFDRLRIFSLDGRLVRDMENISGRVAVWDGMNEDNNFVAPGLYFFAAETGKGEMERGKITVLIR